MKIICISDTHQLHDQIDIPPGDVLVHAGDFCSYGNFREIRRFGSWLIQLPHAHIVVVAGNHDRKFEEAPTRAREELPDQTTSGGVIHYLQDRWCEIGGLKFYGTPWQPAFYDWAFNLPRSGPELKEKWDKIPGDTDILITHGPPHGVLDRTSFPPYENMGCELLRDRVFQVVPKLHVFGHCHAGYGMNYQLSDKTTFINASSCNERYQPVNKPVEIEI